MAKTLATFRLDHKYEIEYEYEFSNQIRVPAIITYHTNLIPNVYLCVNQQQGRVIVWGIQLCRNSKVVTRTRSRTRSQIWRSLCPHLFATVAREIFFLPLKHKIHIISPPCIILFFFTWIAFQTLPYIVHCGKKLKRKVIFRIKEHY